MVLYGMIMLLTAVLFAVVAVMIYRGRVDLIHDYHQKNVKDKTAYGKAFGKAMAVISVGMALSGIVSFFNIAWISVTLLIIGLVIGFVCMYRVQKKYNGGLF